MLLARPPCLFGGEPDGQAPKVYRRSSNSISELVWLKRICERVCDAHAERIRLNDGGGRVCAAPVGSVRQPCIILGRYAEL